MPSVITGKETAHRSPRILRFLELRQLKGIPYSRMHIDRLEKGGKFPKRFNIGPNSVGWLEHEVDEWIAAKAAARGAPTSEQPEPAKAA